MSKSSAQPASAPKVKKWTQLSPEDFTNAGISPVVKRRHSAPPDQLLFHTYPLQQAQTATTTTATTTTTSQPTSASDSFRYVFHHHPYMNKGNSGRGNSTSSTPLISPPPFLRRGSTPAVTMTAPAQPTQPGPTRRRLSLPHNSPQNNSRPKQAPPQPIFSPPPLPGKLAQFKMTPLIEIVEEEMAHAKEHETHHSKEHEMQHSKEHEMHRIHEATAKMHISNLIV